MLILLNKEIKTTMLTIDGKEVDFKEGATVLDVAKENKIYIPALCAHSKLSPFGACRLCIVKIDNMQIGRAHV